MTFLCNKLEKYSAFLQYKLILDNDIYIRIRPVSINVSPELASVLLHQISGYCEKINPLLLKKVP